MNNIMEWKFQKNINQKFLRTILELKQKICKRWRYFLLLSFLLYKQMEETYGYQSGPARSFYTYFEKERRKQ